MTSAKPSETKTTSNTSTQRKHHKSLLILEPLMFDVDSLSIHHSAVGGSIHHFQSFLLSEYGNPDCQRVLVREYYTPKLHKRMLVGRFTNQLWTWDNYHKYWIRLREHRPLSPAAKAMSIRKMYPEVILYARKDDKCLQEHIFCHRLMAAVWCYNPDPLHRTQVDHLDGDRDNYNQINLEWVTPEENIRRRWADYYARKKQIITNQ